VTTVYFVKRFETWKIWRINFSCI